MEFVVSSDDYRRVGEFVDESLVWVGVGLY